MHKINTENTNTNICSQEKSGGFTESLRFSENQVDLRKLGAFTKIRPIYKILALLQKFADLQNLGAFQKLRNLGALQKTGGR
jgi:hypothetical protein